ncbi:hypothetical protein Tco_0940288 [Tanacetum coccineum]|uniref:Uncharacterized protein n=1 Tax=Tanacetum coccineum TaxID=301880 RepID=A0ABQ5DQ56_9ASTR
MIWTKNLFFQTCLQLLTASSAGVKISLNLLKTLEEYILQLVMFQLNLPSAGRSSAEPFFSWTGHASVEPSFYWTSFNLVAMDDPDITIEEYIRLEEEKARSMVRSIVFTSSLTSESEPSSTTTGSIYNSIKFDSNIDFKISYDDSDDEDYTFIYDEKSSSYKLALIDKKTDNKVDESVSLTNVPIEFTDESVDLVVDTKPDIFEKSFVTWYDEQYEIFTSHNKSHLPLDDRKSESYANDSINENLPLNDVLVESLEGGIMEYLMINGAFWSLIERYLKITVQGHYMSYASKTYDVSAQEFTKIYEVLQQQREGVARLGNVLKQGIRDIEIIMAEDTQMVDA